jgi:pentatricopeptide repeat protein
LNKLADMLVEADDLEDAIKIYEAVKKKNYE